ncbi:NUDIX domain-containing protein [Dyadobacter flavalbus]|uniref:NUDIX domain-containing protein n=1 Tax=Dyadobacter flavalbus TaxID=2579942 RepID=A0A5M8QXA0_9BACT|nr:NUDIX domain-containing protein [Dyadobacter flavalbus]KAA6439306.1 NUDIX domain-containing protein [Dyadobacter flavalbus]
MDQIKVVAGVIIWQDTKVLLGFRLSKHGHGVWSFPGGHVEFGEHPDQAVIREAFEETGLVISNVEKITFTSDFYENGTQYITLFFNATSWSGILENREPDKCLEWAWFDPEFLPSPLFIPIRSFLKEKNVLIDYRRQ